MANDSGRMLLLLLLLLLLPQKNDSGTDIPPPAFMRHHRTLETQGRLQNRFFLKQNSTLLQTSANDPCDLKVEFSSKNFKNILTWSTPKEKEQIRYNVKYKVYGNDTWWGKVLCTNITQNWCDLTNETSLHTDQYYGMVVMSDQDCNISKRTERFDPLRDTILDPPEVNLFLTGTTIAIHLTHVVENLSGIYDGLTYEINISGLDTFTSSVPYYKIENLDLQTQYCVSASLSCFRCNKLFSNKTCITTETDHTSQERIKIMLYILSIALTVLAIFGAGYGVHKYIYADNLKQPKILNITSNKKNNVVLVDAYNVTINVITIESGKSNDQRTMMADKEEKTQVKTDQYFTDGGYDASHGSEFTEGDDHGYVSLQEQVPATRPQVSPYDMPHNLVKIPVKPLVAPSYIINTEDLYGRIKCNSNIVSVEEKNMSEETFTYLPKNDQHFPKLDDLNHELSEMGETSLGQDADNVDVKDDIDFSECDTLFVDWSPTSHHLYIPNFHSKTVDKVGTEEWQEAEGLLSQLHKPAEIQETSEELACLEERWQLNVKMQE